MSHGQPVETREDEARLFHEGLRLYNTGEWFEAHEVWEDVWRAASGRKKQFYQGLIQTAVTVEHVRRGNPRGARSVHASCMTKFEGMSGVYMGIDVDRLRDGLNAFMAPVLALPAERFAPEAGRGQPMPIDPYDAPRIELTYDPFAQDNTGDEGLD